ncbi:unnamed protein product [Polarella glacialis]|uniref:Uncharacterized protein n=1 Tax=Polarella glacialis TaxID=89957 RepID=A0A813F5H5_POLGL|nr:unnamed protein product [Polarella glacialis]
MFEVTLHLRKVSLHSVLAPGHYAQGPRRRSCRSCSVLNASSQRQQQLQQQQQQQQLNMSPQKKRTNNTWIQVRRRPRSPGLQAFSAAAAAWKRPDQPTCCCTPPWTPLAVFNGTHRHCEVCAERKMAFALMEPVRSKLAVAGGQELVIAPGSKQGAEAAHFEGLQSNSNNNSNHRAAADEAAAWEMHHNLPRQQPPVSIKNQQQQNPAKPEKSLHRVTNQKLLRPDSIQSSSRMTPATSYGRESEPGWPPEVESVDIDLLPQTQNLLDMPQFHVQPELPVVFPIKSAAQRWLDTA